MKDHIAEILKHPGAVGVGALDDVQHRLLGQAIGEIGALYEAGGRRREEGEAGYAVTPVPCHIADRDAPPLWSVPPG